jgi:GT2 family glycosyltransferase
VVRLRWLLNALGEQTFPADRFEVLAVHDSRRPEIEALLRTHPLQSLRPVRVGERDVFPGAKRNAGWRAARAPLVLFTDDDCRPREDWVATAVAAARSHPGMIVQGRTVPDPDEATILRGAPWPRTMVIDPPTPWAEACNIVYPRQVLERLGGFDPAMRTGEDTDLAIRARAAGGELVADRSLTVYHAVEDRSLLSGIRGAVAWRDMALLARKHPSVRRHMWGALWWKREHAALMAAAAGLALARGHRLAAGLAVPWLALSMRHRGYDLRGVARSVSELPGRAVLDAAEVVALAGGSLRYRTLLL